MINTYLNTLANNAQKLATNTIGRGQDGGGSIAAASAALTAAGTPNDAASTGDCSNPHRILAGGSNSSLALRNLLVAILQAPENVQS